MKIYHLILLLFLISCQKQEDSFEYVKIGNTLISEYFSKFLRQDINRFYKEINVHLIDSQKVVYLSEQNMKQRFCKEFSVEETEIDYFIDNVAQITIPEEFFDIQIKRRFRIVLEDIRGESPDLSNDLKKFSDVFSYRQYIELCDNLKIKYENSPYQTIIYGVIDISKSLYKDYSSLYSEQKFLELHQVCVYGAVIGYFACRNFWKEKPLLGMLFSSLYCIEENILWGTLK